MKLNFIIKIFVAISLILLLNFITIFNCAKAISLDSTQIISGGDCRELIKIQR